MSAHKQKALKRALRCVKRGDLDEAIKAYYSALSEGGRDYRVILRLGDLHRQKNDHKKALEFYREAAEKLSREGFFERAISAYKLVLDIEGPSAKLHEVLAGLYHRVNDRRMALEHYHALSLLHERQGQRWDAIEVLEKMRALDPEDTGLATRLANQYYANGMPDRGYASLQPALKNLRDRGEKKQYLDLLEQVARIHPQNAGNHKELADFFASSGCPALAYKSLSQAAKIEEGDPIILRRLADLAFSLDLTEQAADHLANLRAAYERKGLQNLVRKIESELRELASAPAANAPARPGKEAPAAESLDQTEEMAELHLRLDNTGEALHRYKELAVEYESREQLDKAVAVMEKMAAIDPGNLVIAAKMADLHFRQGRLEQGYRTITPVLQNIRESGDERYYLMLLEKIAKLDPGNRENLEELARFHLARQNREEAYRVFQRLDGKGEAGAEVLRLLAELAGELGRKEEARGYLDRILPRPSAAPPPPPVAGTETGEIEVEVTEEQAEPEVSADLRSARPKWLRIELRFLEEEDKIAGVEIFADNLPFSPPGGPVDPAAALEVRRLLSRIGFDEIRRSVLEHLDGAGTVGPSPEVITDLPKPGPDALEEQFVDLYEVSRGRPGAIVAGAAEVEPPEGYALNEDLEVRLKYFGAMHRSTFGLPLSEEQREVLGAELPEGVAAASAEGGGGALAAIDNILEEFVGTLDKDIVESGSPDPGGENADAPITPDPLPSNLIHPAAVFCPLAPVFELMADTPGASPAPAAPSGERVFNLSHNGRNVSLVGPGENGMDPGQTLEWMIGEGARHVIMLGLGDKGDGTFERGYLVVYPSIGADFGFASKRLQQAIFESAIGRRLDCRPIRLDLSGENSAKAPRAAGADMGALFRTAAGHGVQLGCVLVAAPDLEKISREQALPADHLLTDVWNACYLVLDAAFNVASA